MDAGGVGTGGGFGKTEGAEDFTRGQAAEIFGFLVIGAEGEERSLHGGVGDGDGGGHGGVDLGHFFEHEDVGESVESGAAPLFGEEHAAAAEGAELFDGVERKVIRAFPLFDVGANFGLHEFADGVADEEVVVGEGEVHLVMLARSVRWVVGGRDEEPMCGISDIGNR